MTVRAESEISLARVDDGAAGATGPQGPAGTPGTPATSAYESAVAGGYTGTEAEFNSDLASVSEKVDINVVANAITEALQTPTQAIADLSDRLTPLETDLSQIFEITATGTVLKGLKKVGDDVVEGEFYMKLTANGIYLYKTGEDDPIAYFQATGLDTPIAVADKIQIGDWEFLQRDNDHFSLIKVG